MISFMHRKLKPTTYTKEELENHHKPKKLDFNTDQIEGDVKKAAEDLDA